MRWLVAFVVVVAWAAGAQAAPCGDLAACKAACGKADAKACNQLGTLSLRADPVDLAGAAAAYAKACDGGYAPGCASLALQVQDGRGVPWDEARAVQLYQRACDGGAGVGCFNLALMYDGGNGVPQDRAKAEAMMARAFQLYTVQCETEPLWCTNIGFLYENGMVGGQVDDAKAVAADRKGCDRGDSDACASYALLQLDGKGLAKDRKAAIARLEKLCQAGGALACGVLGHALVDGGHVPARAVALLAKSCELGNAQSCAAASALYGMGEGVAVDQAKSSAYGVRGCDLGDSLACMAEGRGLEAKRPARAADFYQRACQIGTSDGCLARVQLMIDHRIPGGRSDMEPLLKRACALGDNRACETGD